MSKYLNRGLATAAATPWGTSKSKLYFSTRAPLFVNEVNNNNMKKKKRVFGGCGWINGQGDVVRISQG